MMMFPGGMNPRQMKQMMSRMGIKADEIAASSVVIKSDGKDIVIEAPEVMKMVVQGQIMFSISGGKVREEAAEEEEVALEISEEDVKMVAEQTGVSEEQAKAALEESGGDIAEAIIKIKS